MLRSLMVAVDGHWILQAWWQAQKPHAQNHHPKAAEHKAAPVAVPKAGGRSQRH